MPTLPLDWLPLWLLATLAFVTLGVSLEAGYRGGQWRHAHAPDEREQSVGAIVASILTLLALMLGFTFSFAASRFEARRQGVLDEANAIGTTYLRTRLLPTEIGDQSAKDLREYVDARLQGVQGDHLTASIARSEELQLVLWKQAIRAAELQPTSTAVPLYIISLNELIDLHAKRLHVGVRTRIPNTWWLSIFIMSTLSMAAIGYQSGLAATRRSPVMVVMILVFTIVFALIADLDRSQEGLLRVSQQALVDVQTMMKTPLP